MRRACNDRFSDRIRKTENVEDRTDRQSDATRLSLSHALECFVHAFVISELLYV